MNDKPKNNWLEEVKADAEFNFTQRLKEQEAKREYEESKRNRQQTQQEQTTQTEDKK